MSSGACDDCGSALPFSGNQQKRRAPRRHCTGCDRLVCAACFEDNHVGMKCAPAPATERSTDVRRCRVCQCTDDDCSQCIAATGSPCHWVGADLCSRCALFTPAPNVVQDRVLKRAIEAYKPDGVTVRVRIGLLELELEGENDG